LAYNIRADWKLPCYASCWNPWLEGNLVFVSLTAEANTLHHIWQLYSLEWQTVSRPNSTIKLI